MAEIRCVVDLVFWRLSLMMLRDERKTLKTLGKLKLPALGGALVLVAGCGSLVSQQATPVGLRASAQPGNVCPAPVPEPLPRKWEMTVPDHPAIDGWVERFSGKNHKSFQTLLDRAGYYAVPAREVFERRKLPKDLIYVALVESGFSPMARSHAKAVGMWQIISPTGSRFGLAQTKWIDERRHPMKSAEAAADYLSFLYDTFGSWPLALAAYNAGENCVQGALDKSGMKTFWELREGGFLPAETRDYVPKVLAAVRIARQPALYGFRFDPNYYVKRHEVVQIPGGIRLSWLGKKIGVPEESLRDCNPELCRSVTPPGCSNYDLCVPLGMADDVRIALAKHPTPQREEKASEKSAQAPASRGATHRIRPGDTLSGLAARQGCSVKALAALNGMKPSEPLKVGRTVKLPAKETELAMTTPVKREKSKTGSSGNGKGKLSDSGKPVRYLVRAGDSLWSIAEKFHVPLKTLCAQNKINPNQTLVPGDLLTIGGPQQDSVRVARKKAN